MTCYPHSIIYSDVEEDLATGQHLYDAFKDTSPSLRDGNADFAIWRKLHAEGPQSLLPSELSGSDSRGKEEPTRMKIPGWKLDKWKFLPMMNQTYHMHPDKHWYVFVEADTYLLWSSLLADLATRSWTEDLYLGERVWIEDVRFAHGGSGFVLSRSALEKVANLYASNPSHWEEVTEHYWVGDHILAIALRDAGVQLKEGQPTWQGDPFSSLNLRPNGGLWCSTAVTSHHQQPSEIEDLWKLEQALISKAGTTESPELIRHRDIFKSYVLPRIQQPRTSWNNQPRREGHRMKDSKTENASDLLECEAICERDASCMQYTLHDGKDCETISSVILGEEADGFESGWMLERIMKNMEDPDAC
ncbi:unnamed protein product [Zymoseptoria tritici ST99CH_1A5]|uniref:N-acetylgalactosaminide beta-1,3-galactosyltransferase n=1 Tax=Zymoseptoria tritici ST99CH_1A5 TaxID=1276529 RepID=A0A1Y6LT18_ZYMTR|nr:unnamed protein product [Zymoseptoria tritici ST99CH_1A5]